MDINRQSTDGPLVLIVMGVAGSGKTTVGSVLAQQLHCGFSDADDFHSTENKHKMDSGIALTDADREPWLNSLQAAIGAWLSQGMSHVLACSSLRRAYRQKLQDAQGRVLFVYLQISPELAASRLRAREHHYMKVDMVASQFATLEEPAAGDAIVLDASLPVRQLVDDVLGQIALLPINR